MSSRQASSSAVPTPPFLAFGSTPVGPKKLRQVTSWQAKPMIRPSLTAMKQETGSRLNATSASLAQYSEKLSRTQAITLCFSGANARRRLTPSCVSFSRKVTGVRQIVKLDQHVHGDARLQRIAILLTYSRWSTNRRCRGRGERFSR